MKSYYILLNFVPAFGDICNVFRIGPVIELEELPVHGSLVGPTVEPRSNP